jgi:hypothetical protein
LVQPKNRPGIEEWRIQRSLSDSAVWLHRPSARLGKPADLLKHAEVGCHLIPKFLRLASGQELRGIPLKPFTKS